MKRTIILLAAMVGLCWSTAVAQRVEQAKQYDLSDIEVTNWTHQSRDEYGIEAAFGVMFGSRLKTSPTVPCWITGAIASEEQVFQVSTYGCLAGWLAGRDVYGDEWLTIKTRVIILKAGPDMTPGLESSDVEYKFNIRTHQLKLSDTRILDMVCEEGCN